MDALIGNVNEWVSIVLLGFFRPLGMFVIMPMLSSKNLGGSLIRNGAILLISLPVLPTLNMSGLPSLENSNFFALFMLWGTEFIIGLFIGFIAAIPFWALDSASYLIDTMRGSSMATVLNPALGESSTIFGILFSQLLAAIFFAFGGFNHLMTSFYQSYQSFPPGQALHLTVPGFVFFKQQWDMVFSLMFSFALPAVGVMLLVDLGLGLLNRSVQQMNVFFLAMPIKSALVLLLLIISLPFSLRLYQQHMLGMEDMVGSLWGLLREQ